MKMSVNADIELDEGMKINKLKHEINELNSLLQEKENLLRKMMKTEKIEVKCPYSKTLSTKEVSRYSRQMLVPQIGINNQIYLKQSSVLIVGVGGLGCPAALYLAAAGVGTITLLDYDTVDTTNLHRQILHVESSVGISKVESAFKILRSINSNINIVPICATADSETLQSLFASNNYDVVLDGSDNVATGYLLNDICVLNKLPLVSGSALQMEGQLTVYNYKDGPCYRCLFPIPPPPSTVTNCGDGGVLGAVPGTIGVLQALETIKILTKMDDVLHGRLLVFDASSSSFLNVQLRTRQKNCDVCGVNPKISELIDYEQFCQSKAHDKVINISILSDTENIGISELPNLKDDAVIVDVRPKVEYEMCKLPNSVNIPYAFIINNKNLDDVTKTLESYKSKTNKVYFICRRGNDSQRVVEYLKDVLKDKSIHLLNVQGGLYAYAKHIDSSFPIY